MREFFSEKYSPEFLAKLREKFDERLNSKPANLSKTGSADDSVGIFGKISAGLQSVSETINDIVNF
jgi:hypothetical protein